MGKQSNLANVEAINSHLDKSNKTKFHAKDLNPIEALTPAQIQTFESWANGQHLFLDGSAGTGKTFLAMYLALREALEDSSEFDRVVVVRSCVPTREIGFLPGNKEEKEEIYQLPYVSICDELFPFKKSWENLTKRGYVEFISSSYIRGITLNRSIVIVDEAANYTFEELDAVITRCGLHTKMIFCGDLVQTDLNKKRNDVSGFEDFKKIIDDLKDFDIVEFTEQDIVRSGLVKNYIKTKNKMGL